MFRSTQSNLSSRATRAFGKGADFGDLAERIDAYAKAPKAAGVTSGGQAGGMIFFIHLFSTIFIMAGVTSIDGAVRSLFRR